MLLKEFCAKYLHGDFNEASKEVQERAGWYHYHSEPRQLSAYLYKIWEILKNIFNKEILNNFSVYFAETAHFEDCPSYIKIVFQHELNGCMNFDVCIKDNKYDVWIEDKQIEIPNIEQLTNFINTWPNRAKLYEIKYNITKIYKELINIEDLIKEYEENLL